MCINVSELQLIYSHCLKVYSQSQNTRTACALTHFTYLTHKYCTLYSTLHAYIMPINYPNLIIISVLTYPTRAYYCMKPLMVSKI